MRDFRIVVGLLVWAGAGCGVWCCAQGWGVPEGATHSRLAPELWQYATGRRLAAELEMDRPTLVAVGDPIFVADGPNTMRQVGEIRSVAHPDSGEPTRYARVDKCEALFYPSRPHIDGRAGLVYYKTSNSIEWVLETMLPEEKKQQLALELSAAFEKHHTQILLALRPVVEASLREAIEVVEQDLSHAIDRRREELEKLGDKYQREIVEEKILPLVKDEIWPIVRQRAEPTANQVGREIWQSASLWRFGWRYAYDKSPLPEKNLLQQEWDRFLDENVMPVLERHTDDFVRIQQEVLTDVTRNEQVRAAVRRSLSQVTDDPELRQLAWEIVEEVLVENPRLSEVLDKHWTGPEAQRAFQLAAARLEPTVRRIGDMVFGTRKEGITPEFARVLRNQILYKDRRWFVLEPSSPSADAQRAPSDGPADRLVLQVRHGSGQPINPFIRARESRVQSRESRAQSPETRVERRRLRAAAGFQRASPDSGL